MTIGKVFTDSIILSTFACISKTLTDCSPTLTTVAAYTFAVFCIHLVTTVFMTDASTMFVQTILFYFHKVIFDQSMKSTNARM